MKSSSGFRRAVGLEYVVSDGLHLVDAQTRLYLGLFEPSVETLEVLAQLEDLPAERALGIVEPAGRLALVFAQVGQGLAVRNHPSVEVCDRLTRFTHLGNLGAGSLAQREPPAAPLRLDRAHHLPDGLAYHRG